MHLDGIAYGIDEARKLDQDELAGRLDDAPVMFGDAGLECFVAEDLEARDRAFLLLFATRGLVAVPRPEEPRTGAKKVLCQLPTPKVRAQNVASRL